MSTPNIDSVFIRLGIDSYDGNVPLAHVSFFSQKTLVWFLRQHGFTPVYMRTWGVPLRLVAPPYFPTLLQRGKRYYQSREELSLENWHDTVTHGLSSHILKKLHVYDGIKNLCNALLHAINGGTVVDVVAVKQA